MHFNNAQFGHGIKFLCFLHVVIYHILYITAVGGRGDQMGVFDARKIITEHISEADLCTYFVGYDLTDTGALAYRLDSLVKLLISVIPEFALGHHMGSSTPNTELVNTLADAAKAIYNIDCFQKLRDLSERDQILDDSVADKYLRRGEFGELILHLLLRDFKNTIPLISKIYFRDSFGTAVHGFDAVHIQPDSKTLWLGESKLYTSGKQGLAALIDDIKEHFAADYLNSEFAIISRKLRLFDNVPQKSHWVDLLKSSTALNEQLTSINIPLLCTYESGIYSRHEDTLENFINEYEIEMRRLKEHFDINNDHPLKTHLNIILLLFPVKSKKDLVIRLHKNLSALQQLGEL